MFKYLWSLIREFNAKPSPTGVRTDTRSEYDKERDYKHEERNIVDAPNPFSFKKIEFPPSIYLNQLYTSSCVAHGVVLALAWEIQKKIGKAIKPSPIYAYRQRPNYPSAGAWLQAIFNVAKKGVCLYDSLPTPTSEEEANNITFTDGMRKEAEILDGLSYWSMDKSYNNIDEIAKVSATNTMVPILIYATLSEWSREYPLILDPNLDPAKAYVRHCIAVLPNSGFTEKGVDYICVQDSAMFGGLKIRYLSRDFIAKRCFGAAYWLTIDMKPKAGPKPKHKFVVPMSQGSTGIEVLHLQNVLNYEGLLPDDCMTGRFGPRTLAAVRIYQDKYRDEILTPSGLTAPTGNVYSMTMKCLNKYYA